MAVSQLIQQLTQYNQWANKKLNEFLQNIPADILIQSLPYGFGSIENTIKHMAEAQDFWYNIVTGSSNPETPVQTILNTTKTQFQSLLEGSEKLKTICENYSEHDLQMPISSADMMQSRYQFIIHVVNHNSYHRGQIIIMCKQAGVTIEVPNMDYEAWLWHMR